MPSDPAWPGANCMMNGDCREICTAPWQTPRMLLAQRWQAYVVALLTGATRRSRGASSPIISQIIGEELQFLGSNEFPDANLDWLGWLALAC